MSYGWSDEGPPDPEQRWVFVAITSFADKNADCAWPSMPSIVKRSRYSESTVRRCIASLEKIGYLSVVRGRGAGKKSFYTFHKVSPGDLSKVSDRDLSEELQTSNKVSRRDLSKGVTVTEKGVSQTEKGVTQTNPPHPHKGVTVKNRKEPTTTTTQAEHTAMMEALQPLGGADAKAPKQIKAGCMAVRPGEPFDLDRALDAILVSRDKVNSKIDNPLGFVIYHTPAVYETSSPEQRKARAEERLREAEAEARSQTKARAWENFVPVAPELAETVWQPFAELLEMTIPHSSFETWIEPLRPVDLRDMTLYVRVPSEQFLYLGTKYSVQIQACINGDVKFVVCPDEIDEVRS
jgi:hypothetical protein